MNAYWVPTIRAAIAIDEKKPSNAVTIDEKKPSNAVTSVDSAEAIQVAH